MQHLFCEGRSKATSLQRWGLSHMKLALTFAQGRLRQPIRLGIALSRHMRDRKRQGPRQFSAGPVQGVKARAAADVFPGHLPDHNFRIRKDVEFLRLACHGILQGFHECRVLGDIVILMANPLGDADRTVCAAINDHSNARRARISQASAVYIGHQFWHHFNVTR